MGGRNRWSLLMTALGLGSDPELLPFAVVFRRPSLACTSLLLRTFCSLTHIFHILIRFALTFAPSVTSAVPSLQQFVNESLQDWEQDWGKK